MMAWLRRLFAGEPHRLIGGVDDPYLRRWYLIPRNPVFNVYLHHFLRSDDDRALHDHPWLSVSILIKGDYVEVLQDRSRYYSAPAIIVRRPTLAHRIAILQPAWTLFITGPKVREWGFLCPQGWRHWRDFTDPADSGATGRGCE